MGAMTALQQSPAFARALAAYGADVASTAPVVLRRRVGRWGAVKFASRIDAEQIPQLDVRIINGESPCPRLYRAAGFRQIITPAHIAEWDLTQPDLRARLHGKWRNRLRKAETNGLRMRDAVWDGTPHPMFDAVDRLARTRRFRTYPVALLSAFAQINQGDAHLVEAYDQGTCVAGCLILRHGRTATYQSAWSSAIGHALQAPRAVLMHAATRMAAMGHDTLDLGTVETDTAKGLARFKLGTGADLRPLGGTWVRLGRMRP